MLETLHIRDHFLEQAEWCAALGSPFTAGLMRYFAEDFEGQGPVWRLCENWPGNPRKDALGLRLAGALHYATLGGEAPHLQVVYPAAKPDWDLSEIWPLARDWLIENQNFVAAFITSPPQTNETRRSLILLPGLLEVAARFQQPLHLLELGASAGLNQNLDQFSYVTTNWQRAGSSEVHLSTEWQGPPPQFLDQPLKIASRAACDLNPIDLTDPDAVRRLTAYTWPDQADRLARLAAAIQLAQAQGTTVQRANAANWLVDQLAKRPRSGVTVVYHSVFLIYPPRSEIAAIMSALQAAGAEATEEAPLAWLCYESEALFGGRRDTPKMQARLQIWPDGEAHTYAESDGHVTQVKAL